MTSVNVKSFTHCGSWAIDNSGDRAPDSSSEDYSEVFAPVTVTLIEKYNNLTSMGNTCAFSSSDKVGFPDGSLDYLDLTLTHCDDISFLEVGGVYKQGTVIYKEGTKGGVASHVHMEVRKRGNNGLPALKEYWYDASGNSLPNGLSGYSKYTWSLINNEPIQSIFYINDTIIKSDIPFVSGVPGWKTFSSTPFNPVGKPNGWNEYNGEWYYVRNGQCVTGWFQEGSNWYYLEADGKMKKGWLASGNDWFYLSPGSGVMQVNAFVDDDKFYVGADGKMVRTGWTLIGSNYYYFKDKNRDTDSRYAGFADGQKVTSTWIPGSSWFYVLSNGIMAKNCQIRENGKYFAFNNSGACLNSSGQSTAYNTTTYPIRS